MRVRLTGALGLALALAACAQPNQGTKQWTEAETKQWVAKAHKLNCNVVRVPEFLVEEPTREDDIVWHLAFAPAPGTAFMGSGYFERLGSREWAAGVAMARKTAGPVDFDAEWPSVFASFNSAIQGAVARVNFIPDEFPCMDEPEVYESLPAVGLKVAILGDAEPPRPVIGFVTKTHVVDGNTWIETGIDHYQEAVGAPLVDENLNVVGVVFRPTEFQSDRKLVALSGPDVLQLWEESKQ